MSHQQLFIISQEQKQLGKLRDTPILKYNKSKNLLYSTLQHTLPECRQDLKGISREYVKQD